MKVEIVPLGILASACGAMALSVHHLHPECTPGKDLCEVRWVHLQDGQEREPAAPLEQRTFTVTVAASTAVSPGWQQMFWNQSRS